MKLANGVFCWNSIMLSSTKAEYMLLSDTCRQLVWICSLFEELGITLTPIQLRGDNPVSIFLASNPVQEKRIKHIDLRYHYICKIIREMKIELFFLEGAENPADLFTKNLGHIKCQKFREELELEFYLSLIQSPKTTHLVDMSFDWYKAIQYYEVTLVSHDISTGTSRAASH